MFFWASVMASDPPNHTSLAVFQPKPSVDFFTKDIAHLESKDVRALTNEWIMKQGNEHEQLAGLRELFQTVTDGAEIMGEVIQEAWAVFLSRKVWRVKYQTKEEAIAAIDTPLLNDVRARATEITGVYSYSYILFDHG